MNNKLRICILFLSLLNKKVICKVYNGTLEQPIKDLEENLKKLYPEKFK